METLDKQLWLSMAALFCLELHTDNSTLYRPKNLLLIFWANPYGSHCVIIAFYEILYLFPYA